MTDIFARRYEKRPMFNMVGPREHALFVQAYRLINEQVFQYYNWDKKVNEKAKATWTSLHDRLTMELGLKELSPKWYSYQGEWMGKPHTYNGSHEMNYVCEQWLNKQFSEGLDEDVFVKRRLSFIELAFRERGAQIAFVNYQLPAALQQAGVQNLNLNSRSNGMRIAGSRVEGLHSENKKINAAFNAQVHELNERFTQAGMPLHYHNGFIQITQDELIQKQVEEPFWDLLKASIWQNVDTDMKEAIDRRDTSNRDPSFYAAKALESTIKIICDLKHWTTGNERGVSDFLNHLESKANGGFIEGWERQSIQRFYNEVRNDLGHGPGSAQMPNFTLQQVDHTIEFCMSWVKSLIKRL